MSKLSTRAQPAKDASPFQNLWRQAEQLQQQQIERDQELNELAERVQLEVLPAEIKSAGANTVLLLKLLKFGCRKSLNDWQREELHEWIHDNLQILHPLGLINRPVQDALALYEAFRIGVTLDSNDPRPLREQFHDALDAQEAEAAAEREATRRDLDATIETIIDTELGPGPIIDNPDDPYQQAAHEAYQQAREKLRATLQASMSAELDSDEDGEWSDPPADDPDNASGEQTTDDAGAADTPHLDNNTFKRLFRLAASALHPDKETDPDRRLTKHQLMAQLLTARKQGDVMTVINLYQQHSDGSEALTSADEKAMLAVLEQQVERLEAELKKYRGASHAHELAWQIYRAADQDIDKAITRHLQELKVRSSSVSRLQEAITSLKTLVPCLTLRYDTRQSEYPYG